MSYDIGVNSALKKGRESPKTLCTYISGLFIHEAESIGYTRVEFY